MENESQNPKPRGKKVGARNNYLLREGLERATRAIFNYELVFQLELDAHVRALLLGREPRPAGIVEMQYLGVAKVVLTHYAQPDQAMYVVDTQMWRWEGMESGGGLQTIAPDIYATLKLEPIIKGLGDLPVRESRYVISA